MEAIMKSKEPSRDITNVRFNMLIAVNRLYQYRREWVWECRCDCGNDTKVRISKLTNGRTKSCGCFKARNIAHKSGEKHPQWGGYEDISLSFFSRMKAGAILRCIEFDITIEDLWRLFQAQEGRCAYTGEPIFLPKN